MNLSIVVPVYNVVKYLERCVQSIVAQALADYEIVLVDDGSTDGSGALCDELQQRYACIEVVHQLNGGLSAARNAGIEIARGAYITFVDSDDMLAPHTMEKNIEFLLQHPEVDMLEYPVEVRAGSADAYMLTFADETQTADVFADWIRREGYRHCYACNKIFAARVWKEIRFPDGLYFEDVAIMPDVIRQCRCVHYSSYGCYRYIMQPGSITTSYRYLKQRHLFEGNHRLYMELKDDVELNAQVLHLWISCLNQLVDMGRCADVDAPDYARVVGEADKWHPSYKALIKAAPDMMTGIKLLPLPVLGLRTYCRMYVALTKSLRS